jgi:putative membrane protein
VAPRATQGRKQRGETCETIIAGSRGEQQLMRFVIRLIVNAAALWVAIRLVPGITFAGDEVMLLVVALIFGVVNAVIRPVLTLLSLPILILTLGLFTFVLNALMLWLTSWLSGALGLGFHVAGFWPAFLGALVVTIVSALLSFVVRDVTRGRR